MHLRSQKFDYFADEAAVFSCEEHIPFLHTWFNSSLSSMKIVANEQKADKLMLRLLMATNFDSLPCPSIVKKHTIDVLGPYDIIIGRGRKFENNIGNKRFRVTIQLNLKRYLYAPTRQDKTILILTVFHMLKDDIGARFVKCTDDGRYEICGNEEGRDKVAHALRDLAAKVPKQSSSGVVRRNNLGDA